MEKEIQTEKMGGMNSFEIEESEEQTPSKTSFYKKLRKMKYACIMQCFTVCSVFFFLILDIIMKYIQAKTNSLLTQRMEKIDSLVCAGENCTSNLEWRNEF